MQTYPMSLSAGMVINNKYSLIHCFLATNKTAVFLAYDMASDRKVVIKFARGDFKALHENETATLKKLNERQGRHPCRFPEILDEGKFGESSYVVMQAIAGSDLRERLSQDITVSQAVEWVMVLLSGLMTQGEINIVHRDLKPENVMIDENGMVYLIDFELACPIGYVELSGETVGTPLYLSPEQTQIAKLDQRADVYSLGLMLYEMLTGEIAMYGKTEPEILKNQISKETPDLDPQAFRARYEPLPELRPFIDRLRVLLNDIIKRMTSKNREKRPADLDGLVLELYKAWQIARKLSLYEKF